VPPRPRVGQAVLKMCVCCHSDGTDVSQLPTTLSLHKGQNAEMNCTHNKGLAFRDMYWYRQRPGENIELIVYTSVGLDPDYGKFDKNKFGAVKKEATSGFFTVKNLEAEDSGVCTKTLATK
uniref:Immunoglobulin V-set domain-containing protein n=1 Tax=Scleropages formosus TaxID=113540 RepID=A0A8C9W7C1_SCLFO